MHHPFVLLCVFACCAAGEALATPPADPKLTFSAESFSQQRSVQFGPDGTISNENTSCNLSLRGTSDRRIVISETTRNGSVTLTAALTDSGESLIPDDANQAGYLSSRSGRSGRQEHSAQFSLQLNLRAPSKPVTAFTRIAGTIAFGVADPKLRRVEIKPLSTFSGTAVAIEGFTDLALSVVRSADSVKLSGPRALFTNLAETRFTTADGAELDTRGGGSSSNNDRVEREFRVAVPEDGAVVLFFHQNIRQVTMPFELKDVRVAKAVDLKPKHVLKATEVESTDPPESKAGGGF